MNFFIECFSFPFCLFFYSLPIIGILYMAWHVPVCIRLVDLKTDLRLRSFISIESSLL